MLCPVAYRLCCKCSPKKTSCLSTQLQALIDQALCVKARMSDLLDVSPKSLSSDRSFAAKKRAKALSELANSEIKRLRANLQAKASDKKQHSTSQSSKSDQYSRFELDP